MLDDGMGLPGELLPRIFEPSVQGERKLRGSVGGLVDRPGAGKNLAEMHGGTVTAHSAGPGPGQGSKFIVHLPLTQAPGSVSSLSTIKPLGPEALAALV